MGTSENGDAKRERELAESIWLNYFNCYLYEAGTISLKEYCHMSEKITNYHKNRSRMKSMPN